MKYLIFLFSISVFVSCSSTRSKIIERNEKSEAFVNKTIVNEKKEAEAPEKLKWFAVLETPKGTSKQAITKSILKISDDIYCAFEKEHKQGPFEKNPGMRSKGANCILLLENFQIHTYCDKDNKIQLLAMVKEEKELDFKLSVQCELE